MTAIPRRRTRATVVGLVASVVSLVAVIGLGAVGVATLADSTAGEQAREEGQPVVTQRLPFTSTALIGAADDDGRLTTLVVAVLESDGTGGSIVQIPVAADPSSGSADTLSPIDAVLSVAGPIAFREAVERLTGLSFDVIEITDQQRFAELMSPLGDMEVQLPGTVVDVSSDEVWEAGGQVLTTPGAARLVTAVDPSLAGWAYEPVRTAVWQAVTDRVGAGIGSASPVAVDTDLPIPGSSREFLDRLFAGPVALRVLQFEPVEAEDVDERLGDPYHQAFGEDSPVSVVVLDRAEMLMVFGGVAPARLGAPLDSPNFRIVNALRAADTEPLERTPTDLTKQLVTVLIFTKVNVISVVEDAGAELPEITQLRIFDPSLLDAVEGIYAPHLGEVEVVASEAAIDGIDVEIVLGRSFLDFVEEVAARERSDVAGSSDDAPENDADEDDATDD